MTAIKLFDDDNTTPLYQPIPGYAYHEPNGRTSHTYWIAKGSQEQMQTGEVASAMGIDSKDLLRWENATDLEAEAEGRSDGW